MDEPLFGEKTQKSQIIVYIIGSIVSLFFLFSLIVSIIFGIQNKEHFILSAVIVCIFVTLVILFKWYWAGELDSRFKYLIGLVILTVFFTGIAINIYVWQKVPSCNGLYRFSDGVCFPNCATGTCLIPIETGTCFVIPSCNSTLDFE